MSKMIIWLNCHFKGLWTWKSLKGPHGKQDFHDKYRKNLEYDLFKYRYEDWTYHNGWHCWLRQWWPCNFHYHQYLSVERSINKQNTWYNIWAKESWHLNTTNVCACWAFQCYFRLFWLNGFEISFENNQILLPYILTTNICIQNKTRSYKLQFQNMQD